MESEVPANEGPCSEAYEYDLPDSDMLGPNYEAEETNPKETPATQEETHG